MQYSARRGVTRRVRKEEVKGSSSIQSFCTKNSNSKDLRFSIAYHVQQPVGWVELLRNPSDFFLNTSES